MPRFHHVNLGIPPDEEDAEIGFLVDVLGYRRIDPGEALASMGALWFEGEDGGQIHLSRDADHRPAAKAHVAVEYADDLDRVGQKLREAGQEVDRRQFAEGPEVLICLDPAGNRWELRARPVSSV